MTFNVVISYVKFTTTHEGIAIISHTLIKRCAHCKRLKCRTRLVSITDYSVTPHLIKCLKLTFVICSSNLSITLTEDGYLVTNILSSARVYNIGKVKTERFVNYVLANGSGKQIDTDSTESSQAAA